MNKTGNAGIFAETMSVWNLPPVWNHCSITNQNLQIILWKLIIDILLLNSYLIHTYTSLTEFWLKLFIYCVDLSRMRVCDSSNDAKNKKAGNSQLHKIYFSRCFVPSCRQCDANSSSSDRLMIDEVLPWSLLWQMLSRARRKIKAKHFWSKHIKRVL